MKSFLSKIFLRLDVPFLSIAFLTCLSATGAEYLPDAAAHLGTIVINQDDQFTTNQNAILAIKAINPGSGVVQMQFSNDGQNWSASQSYATNKSWQLPVSVQDYPPGMRTVLKTVYVRFKYGDGTWSKAVSDSLVFAQSAQDLPKIKELWIMQQRPPNYNAAQPLGSQLNPYIVPPGQNEVAFDTLMNSLTTTYADYRGTPYSGQTDIPPMSEITVPLLHIGAGSYETHGDNWGQGGLLAWGPGGGWRIKGAGKNNTILKLVGGDSVPNARVIGNYGGSGMAVYDNLEISDLTVNANMHEGGNTNSPWDRIGVGFSGNNTQLRRLRVKGFGSRIPGLEPGGLVGHNSGTVNTYNFMIEDCEVIAPQSINQYTPLMIGYGGGGTDAQGNPIYMNNLTIRNNYVNGLMYDQDVPLNSILDSFDRGSHGIVVGGTRNAIVEDNLIVHVGNGFYNDTFDLNDVWVRNNHFRDVISGLNFLSGAADALRFEGNLVELDPHHYTATDRDDYLNRFGNTLSEGAHSVPINKALIYNNTYQFTDGRIPDVSVNGYFASLNMSGSADFQSNRIAGFSPPFLIWYNSHNETYLEQQADIKNPTNRPPVNAINNRLEDGTVIEAYPYVLDKTIPRPVVVPNQQISFPAPRIKGALPRVVTGLPSTNVMDQNGNFTWKPTADDVGRYVVSFYDSISRTNDPRRTLITVESGLTDQDPLYFSQGLKGYWKFQEEEGNTFADSTGSGNDIPISDSIRNFTTQGAPGHIIGRKALHFSSGAASQNSIILIPNENQRLFSGFPLAFHPFLQRSTVLMHPFTMSFWFVSDQPPADTQLIFNFGFLVQCGVQPDPNAGDGQASLFCDYRYSPDFTRDQAIHPQNMYISTAQWHHLVFVYDGVSIRLYLEGTKKTELPMGQIEDFDISAPLYLGGGRGTENFTGSFSDLAIWNRPLSQTEVTRLHLAQKNDIIFPSPRRPASPSNLRTAN